MITLKLAKGITYTLDDNNDAREENARLVGFQATADVQRVALFVSDWPKDRQAAVGMFPVFSTGEGLYCITVPVEKVEVSA